jgi:hypothetical protein
MHNALLNISERNANSLKNIGDSHNSHRNSFNRSICLPSKHKSKSTANTYTITIALTNLNAVTYHIALPKSNCITYAFP